MSLRILRLVLDEAGKPWAGPLADVGLESERCFGLSHPSISASLLQDFPNHYCSFCDLDSLGISCERLSISMFSQTNTSKEARTSENISKTTFEFDARVPFKHIEITAPNSSQKLVLLSCQSHPRRRCFLVRSQCVESFRDRNGDLRMGHGG